MRVMSWNVHAMTGSDGRCDPERIARVIEKLRPDIAGLQEVATPGAGREGPNPAQVVGALAGMRSAFGATMHHRLGSAFGNAVLSPHPILSVRNYDLSVPGREPRGCVRADVALDGTHVHFFAAHLGLHWRERRRQAAQLLSADILRDAALAHPLVLVGDFNSLSVRSAVPRWLRRQLVDCARVVRNEAPTFPAWFPLLRLDHCYVDTAFSVLSVEVVRSPLTRRASDHLPVVVELELSPEARRLRGAASVEARAGAAASASGERRPAGSS